MQGGIEPLCINYLQKKILQLALEKCFAQNAGRALFDYLIL